MLVFQCELSGYFKKWLGWIWSKCNCHFCKKYPIGIKALSDVSPAGHFCLVLDTEGLLGLKNVLMYDQKKSFK